MRKVSFYFKHIIVILSWRSISLFVWGFSSHSKIFHSYGDVTITGEWLQILS